MEPVKYLKYGNVFRRCLAVFGITGILKSFGGFLSLHILLQNKCRSLSSSPQTLWFSRFSVFIFLLLFLFFRVSIISFLALMFFLAPIIFDHMTIFILWMKDKCEYINDLNMLFQNYDSSFVPAYDLCLLRPPQFLLGSG